MLTVRQKNEMKKREGGGVKGNEGTALEKFVRSWLLDKFLGKYPFVSHPMQHVCAAPSSFPLTLFPFIPATRCVLWRCIAS